MLSSIALLEIPAKTTTTPSTNTQIKYLSKSSQPQQNTATTPVRLQRFR